MDIAVRASIAAPLGLLFGALLGLLRQTWARSLIDAPAVCRRCDPTDRPGPPAIGGTRAPPEAPCLLCGRSATPSALALALSCAALFAAAGARFERVAPAALVGPFLGVALAAAVVDARRWTIPNRLVLPAFAGCGVFIATAGGAGLGLDPVGAVVGGIAFGGGLLGIALLAPSAMGMGDVKLAALVGLVLGSIGLPRVGVAATTAVLSAGLLAAALVLGARKSPRTAMPFGPFLFAGALVGAFLSS